MYGTLLVICLETLLPCMFTCSVPVDGPDWLQQIWCSYILKHRFHIRFLCMILIDLSNFIESSTFFFTKLFNILSFVYQRNGIIVLCSITSNKLVKYTKKNSLFSTYSTLLDIQICFNIFYWIFNFLLETLISQTSFLTFTNSNK